MTREDEHLHYLKVLQESSGILQPEFRRAIGYAISLIENCENCKYQREAEECIECVINPNCQKPWHPSYFKMRK